MKAGEKKRWTRFSQDLRFDRGERCEACKTTQGRIECHHVLDRVRFPQLLFEKDGFVILCQGCHSFAPEILSVLPAVTRNRLESFVQKHAANQQKILDCCRCQKKPEYIDELIHQKELK